MGRGPTFLRFFLGLTHLAITFSKKNPATQDRPDYQALRRLGGSVGFFRALRMVNKEASIFAKWAKNGGLRKPSL